MLTVDLTNRCNMMCNPCFMDANQVGYVHELTFDDVKKILDDSISFKPRRQMVVQYSGGEPTMSPHFLEACAYAKKVGYRLIQAATNGLRFAIEPEFAFQAKEAGLDMVYLQFDGTTNESNAHRHITNLFDVRQVAIDNLAAAGVRITPVVTVVNGVNNQQVGPIFDYCLANHDKMGGPAFQPVSFTGRDEEVSDEARLRQRYTTSHLAHDLARYYDGQDRSLPRLVPARVGHGAGRPRRPHEGARGGLRPAELRLPPQLRSGHDDGRQLEHQAVGDGDVVLRPGALLPRPRRGRRLGPRQGAHDYPARALVPAQLRREEGAGRPDPARHASAVRQQDGGRRAAGDGGEKKTNDWRITSILSMWFQDLWNYDFRRTEMCVIPYGTQEGEISFCAYNTGVGWRNIIEEMRQVASTQDWFAQKGRHAIYAGNRPIALPKALKRQLPVVAVEAGNGNGNGNGHDHAHGQEAQGQGCGTGCGCSH